MKKYILIQNDGEIESNSFELIGASTKRGQEGKIGFFGSGLKYSIAYMMRSGIEFKVFSGEQELKFSTKEETLKENKFERIIINGVQTSYTTTMGPTWREDWFVLREIYCNALDEESCMIVKETDIINSVSGKTRIYIELTDSLKNVSSNWDNYFADERVPIFTSQDVYTCFLGNEDGGVHRQSISVYKKTVGVLYRKGIRVHTNKDYIFDYDCGSVNINEDRTAKQPSGLDWGIYNMVSSFTNEGYIKSILRTAQDDERCSEYSALSCGERSSDWSDEWVRFSKENLLVIKDRAGKYANEIQCSKKEVFLIPSFFARDLKKNIPEAYVLGMSSIIDGVSSSDVLLTNKMEFLLKEVLESLSQMNYVVNFDISVVDFDDEEVLGRANIKEKKILLASKTFDMGRREIAMTLMEENEHIKSQCGDETRAFQNHIFSQWLKSIEDAHGLFL